MAKIYCPGCKQLLEHDRGYLPTHIKDLQRGQLVTGSKVCEFSNRKIVTELAEVTYTYECPDCGLETSTKLTENHPGAFSEGIKAFIEMPCIGCTVSHDGYYCSHQECGTEVVEKPNDFYRVSDSLNQHLPKLEDDEEALLFRDFDTETEASTYIASILQPDDELDRYNVELMQAGWYDKRGENDCRAALADPRALLVSGNDPTHQGEFKAQFVKTVLVTDGHVINEEPDEGEAFVPEPEPVGLLVCDCCQLTRTTLPFKHQPRDGGPEIEYCQECEDAGCDLVDCTVRANQRAGRAHA